MIAGILTAKLVSWGVPLGLAGLAGVAAATLASVCSSASCCGPGSAGRPSG